MVIVLYSVVLTSCCYVGSGEEGVNGGCKDRQMCI